MGLHDVAFTAVHHSGLRSCGLRSGDVSPTAEWEASEKKGYRQVLGTGFGRIQKRFQVLRKVLWKVPVE